MRKWMIAAIAALLLASSQASAGLLGATIRAEARYPDAGTLLPSTFFSPNPFVVGPGIETTASDDIGDFYTVDFADAALTIAFLDFGWIFPADFNGVAFLLLSGTGFDPILDVQASRGQTVLATLAGNELRLNLQNQEFAAGDTINLTFAPPAAVPAPAGLGVLAIGLLGLAAVRRRAG